jgi:hypothetical protein
MESFASFWNYARILGAIILIFVVVLAVAGIVRSRRAGTESPAPSASHPMEIDADLLDSSHIGFAPLVGSVSLPSREKRGENNRK